MQKVCAKCGKIFEGRTTRAKYCSSNCKEAARRARNMVTKFCEHCGKQFLGYAKYEHKYCSPSCSLKHSKIQKTLTCIDCGSQFQFIGRTRKLRCDTCWHKHKSAAVMRSRAKKDPSVKTGVGSGNSCQHPNIQVYDKTKRDVYNAQRRQKYKKDKETGRLRQRYPYRKQCINQTSKCVCCGYSARTQALVVHHVDMNRVNNSPENLVVLCCNCHAIVHAQIRQALKQSESVDPKMLLESLKSRN